MKASTEEPALRSLAWPLSDGIRGLLVVAALLLCLAAVVVLGKTLTPFYIAFVLVYLLNPAVTFIARQAPLGLPLGRLVGIVAVYVAFGMALWFLSLFVFPQLYHEFARLAQLLPRQFLQFEREALPGILVTWQSHLDAYNVPFNLEKSLHEGITSLFEAVNGQLGELAKRARDLIAGVFSAILLVVLVFMLTGFLLYDLPRFKAWLARLVPVSYRAATRALMADIDRGLAGAVRGQIGVCIVNGVLTTLGLMALGVKFAITLGVLAGFFSLIPVFGTLFSSVPIVAVALTNSLATGLLALVWILVIHLIEANFLNPNIIGHNAELHPALVVLALLIGEHYGGPVGLLIAVPIATVVRAILTYTVGKLLLGPPAEASEPLASATQPGPPEPGAVTPGPDLAPEAS
ncbi:MAG: AI-2E family transporter [Candidatus Sericytochromatia bacterium]|nr:AI-2E family transporter [Candidatus Sericytochromatia bacterium]